VTRLEAKVDALQELIQNGGRVPRSADSGAARESIHFHLRFPSLISDVPVRFSSGDGRPQLPLGCQIGES
jgi:hypothetical protein